MSDYMRPDHGSGIFGGGAGGPIIKPMPMPKGRMAPPRPDDRPGPHGANPPTPSLPRLIGLGVPYKKPASVVPRRPLRSK